MTNRRRITRLEPGDPTFTVSAAWKPHVFPAPGMVDRHALTFALVEELREALHRRDVFANESTRWGDPRRLLLDGKAWEAERPRLCRALEREPTPQGAISALRPRHPGTLRDSPYILDGLLQHQTCLKPTQLMTDTAGYSDLVFGLFWLLGLRFSPRLADLGDARLWRIDRSADYGPLDGVARQTLNTKLIADNWDDMLRVAGSLLSGRVAASEIIRALQAGGRLTTLARTISEAGRAPKTMHLLAFIDDENYRRAILTQLNRQEGRHGLARSVFHGKRGELR